MTTVESSLQPWRRTEVWLSTGEKEMRAAPLSRVIQVVNEILGYDLIHAQLLTEGYLLHREEDRRMAEEDMGAGFETLPPMLKVRRDPQVSLRTHVVGEGRTMSDYKIARDSADGVVRGLIGKGVPEDVADFALSGLRAALDRIETHEQKLAKLEQAARVMHKGHPLGTACLFCAHFGALDPRCGVTEGDGRCIFDWGHTGSHVYMKTVATPRGTPKL